MNRFFTKSYSIILLLLIYSSLVYAQAPCDTLKSPTISSEKTVSCAGQAVILKATGCTSEVLWSNKKKGASITVTPTNTTTYTAICQNTICKSKPSNELTIQISIPATPAIVASKTKICFGESITLQANGCSGDIIWSNNEIGKQITVTPIATTKYTATCKTEGCVSCFADAITITVQGGSPLALLSSQSNTCANQQVTLNAKGNCNGIIKWDVGKEGNTIVVAPTATTVYTAQCVAEGCEPSTAFVQVNVAPPFTPIIQTSRSIICAGESVLLTAQSCDEGIVVWSNQMKGTSIVVSPTITTTYTATCERGSCRSQISAPITVTVSNETVTPPQAIAELTNKCPFMTIDLSAAIENHVAGLTYEAHIGDAPSSALVNNVGAITESKTYYLFAKNAIGCYSTPTAVKTVIKVCTNPILPCISNPATATIIKTEPTTAGNYILEGQWGGAAKTATWNTTGTGSFSSINGMITVYTPSPADRQLGKITIEFTTDDPDSLGSCAVGKATMLLNVLHSIEKSKEMIGLAKKVSSIKRLNAQQFEINYELNIQNMGENNLIEVSLIDSLDKTFKNGAIVVDKPTVNIYQPDNTLNNTILDTTFTGKNGNYSLFRPELVFLEVGKSMKVQLLVKVDIAQAKDSVFYNSAYVTAIDINGNICSDISNNSVQADSNNNGDASDDSNPTPIVLNAQAINMIGNIFIPDGFSPNADGINDVFVIKKPDNITISLEVYNRAGGLVYKNEDYKNDWAGISSAKNHVPTGTYFYVVKLNDGREFSRFLTISR